MASVRTTVMKMKHDASRLSPLVERVPSDVHLLLFDRLGSPRVLYPLLNLTEDESGSEPTCCPQLQRPVKECLGSTFNVSEEENRGIHLFRLLVSNPSLFVRAHDRGELEHEKIRLSVFQSPDSISVVVAKIIVKHRYPAIEPATLIEYAARLTSSKKKLRSWTSWTSGNQTLLRPPGDPDETNNDARRSQHATAKTRGGVTCHC